MLSTTSYSTLNDLVNQMKGVPTTNGWDVVCSYNVSQLNEFLKALYDKDILQKTVNVETLREDPFSGAKMKITYTIQFASPTLSFVTGRSGMAYVTMPINEGSSYSITQEGVDKPTKTKSIPGGKYSVRALVPLAAVQGDTGEVVEDGEIVTFSDGVEHDNHVILHFKSEKGTLYEILPTPDPTDMDVLVTYFLPVLQNYFQTTIKEVDYALTTINNITPKEGLTILTPSFFVFASTGEDEDGVLSLYIQTKESQNPSGNISPSFQPGDKALSPIPQDYTVSLVLSNSLIQDAFMKPQLEATGFSVNFTNPTDGDGISFQLRKDENIFSTGKSGTGIFSGYNYDGLSINLKDNPLNVTVKEGQIGVSFSGRTSSEWSEYIATGHPGGNSYGKVDVTISVNKSATPIILSEEDDIHSSVSLNASDFNVSTSAHGCSVWEGFNGCRETVPAFYERDLPGTLQIPSINLNLTGLNFFNTTNLLAPGEHVIQFDSTKGVQTPHDFLLVGNVVKKNP
jgi:hypothetical protein